MANIESQPVNHLSGNSLSHFDLPQRQNHALHNTGIPSVTSTSQLNNQWEDVPPAVGHGTIKGTVQNLHHINVANYGIADYQGPPEGLVLAGPYTYPDVGLAQGIPEHVQAISPKLESQGNVAFSYVPQGVVPGSTQAAFPGPSSGHRGPALGRPAGENLRRLANHYVNHPDSQVDMVRMEPGSADRYKVVIVLEIADFL